MAQDSGIASIQSALLGSASGAECQGKILRKLTPTSPASAASTVTVPAGFCAVINFAMFRLVTSATVASRQIGFQILDPNNVIVFSWKYYIQTASSALYHNLCRQVGANNAQGDSYVYAPPEVYVPAGYKIKYGVLTAADAGDVLTNYEFYVELFPIIN